QLAAVCRNPAVAPLLQPEMSDAIPVRQLRLYLRNALAIRRYEPAPAALKVWLYRAGSSVARDEDPTLGWGAIAQQGVQVRRLPGDHHSLMRPPNVAALADALRADLARRIDTDPAVG